VCVFTQKKTRNKSLLKLNIRFERKLLVLILLDIYFSVEIDHTYNIETFYVIIRK